MGGRSTDRSLPSGRATLDAVLVVDPAARPPSPSFVSRYCGLIFVIHAHTISSLPQRTQRVKEREEDRAVPACVENTTKQSSHATPVRSQPPTSTARRARKGGRSRSTLHLQAPASSHLLLASPDDARHLLLELGAVLAPLLGRVDVGGGLVVGRAQHADDAQDDALHLGRAGVGAAVKGV